MSNADADRLQDKTRHNSFKISELYPDILSLRFDTIETNGHHWNRLENFDYSPDHDAFFILRCPYPKCVGTHSGIGFSNIVSEMYDIREKERNIRLTCGGYGGYNMTFHCDWYIVAHISITYKSLNQNK